MSAQEAQTATVHSSLRELAQRDRKTARVVWTVPGAASASQGYAKGRLSQSFLLSLSSVVLGLREGET